VALPDFGQALLNDSAPAPASDEFSDLALSSELRAELLDSQAWSKTLETYARTTRLAVALTDADGRLRGPCHNPQPVWSLAHRQADPGSFTCSFCLSPEEPCTAVPDALRTGKVAMVHDLAGLSHVAIPLALGNLHLGALIAGQVFSRYPELLPLQRIARDSGIAPQVLWMEAGRHAPVSGHMLHTYGDLLGLLGQAFLRQRYGAILDRQLRKTDRRYRLFVEGVKDYALFTVSIDGCITSWNAGAERLLLYTAAEIVGQDYSRFFTPEDIQRGIPERELQIAAGGGLARDEGWRVRKNGSRFFCSGVLAPAGDGNEGELGKLMHDITEQHRTEESLLQTQKLESIGVLAGGIAHDFNNLLTGILGGVSLAKNSLESRDPAYTLLEVAERACEKAADLVSQLLAYSGKGFFVISALDLSSLIAETMPLIATSIPKTVQLHLKLAPDLPAIEADASKIRQIVMNLVINGAEAIGPQGGTLRVLTKLAATEVCFEVQDSGSGMSEETKARIFDPFFTTKFTGRGLGLAAVSGIVRAHKGRMEVESVPHEGSAFRVFFPISATPVPTVDKSAARTDLQGTGCILVVDDEPLLRQVAKTILERYGYTVLLAENGREAVQMVRESGDTVAAVLLDLTMPQMGGAEALRLIRQIRPGIPVIISSGYSASGTREQLGVGAVADFLQKPYSAVQLGEKIQAALL
jgi:PAS domain S-box-containing protein